MTGNVMVVTLSVFTGDAVHYSASDMQKTIQSHTLRVGLARNTPNRTLRYWQRMPRTCSCSEIERLKNNPLLPTEWAQSLVRSTTSVSNTNLKLQSECFGLLFRFQMVLGYLFADQNGHLTAERGDFFNMSVLFRHTLGKRPFSRVFARPRGKSSTDGKAISGMSCTREVKGPQSVATRLWFTDAASRLWYTFSFTMSKAPLLLQA